MEKLPAESLYEENIAEMTDSERDPEVAAAFAQAEAGMEEIPHLVEVESIDDLAKELGLSPQALEQYRVENSQE